MSRHKHFGSNKVPTLWELQHQQDNAVDRQRDYKPMNGRELRVLEFLAVRDVKLTESGEAIRERLKEIPNGWRQWRLMTTTVSRLLVQLYDVVPVKNLRHMQNLCQYGEVLIRIRPPVYSPEYALLREDDLKQLMDVAILQECGMCLKEGKEIDRCPLRKAMWNIAPPMDESPYSCEYSHIAIAMAAEKQKQ